MTSRGQALLLAVLLLLMSLMAFAGFAQIIDLPRVVPAFNQAYKDGADAWGNCPLGTIGCPDQVCTSGCLVTAFSSVLAYYEIDVAVPARSSCTGKARTGMDPGIFNDWLREVGGYGRCAQDPVGNCCLIWEQLPGALEITTHVNRSEVGVSPVSSVVIDHALRQGYPVIAGVHWGASCSGGSTQSEDCHWVILTGKREDTYAIVDPFNPDPASPNGVRTTLNAGVHGNYIIDRFVVVAGPTLGPIRLEITSIPKQAIYQVGDRIRLLSRMPGTQSSVLPFARVTRPSGDVVYAVLAEPTSRTPRYSPARDSLVPDPRMLDTGWTWYDRTATESDIGRWTWEIWVEKAREPGIKFGRQTISYNIEPARSTSSIGAAVLGILLVVAIAAIAFISTLGSASE
jgi:hypothetical protein